MQEPQVLHLTRRPITLADYKLRAARESDYTTLINQPTVIFDDEQQMVTIVYLQLDDDCSRLVDVLRRIEYQTTERTGGLLSTSKIFGYKPRVALRSDFCTSAALAHQDPEANQIVSDYARVVSRYYERYNPDLYAAHQRQVERVLPEWTLEDSVFTSGIINKDNPLLYHHDTGNFRNVWSNMLGFKRGVRGGYLAVPEYDLALEIADNTLTMFDGQNLLHGVTPFAKSGEDAYRFTVVFYSLKAMWNCLTPEQEVRRIQQLRTEREHRRADRDAKGEVFDPKKKLAQTVAEAATSDKPTARKAAQRAAAKLAAKQAKTPAKTPAQVQA